MTRDEKTGKVLECTRKIRLGDLNVYSPKRAADWRVSVNMEIPGEHFRLAPWRFEIVVADGKRGQFHIQ